MSNKVVINKLLWIDLEMTGLNPQTDRILEVAAIVTDLNFTENEVYEIVIKQTPEVLARMDEWNQTQHKTSGLLARVPNGISEELVDQNLEELVGRHFSGPVTLAGNSVYCDRQFIQAYLPLTYALLHYRMLDVSAWKIVMQAKFNHVFAAKAEGHRALADIRESITELKDYLDYFSTR